MQVSVITPTHNRPAQLAVALESVRTLDFDGDLEVIVVNDNGLPVDDVVEAAREKLNVRLINRTSNGGVSQARNDALAVAEGEYVAFLDDDDLLSPQHLAGTLPLLRAGADLVYTGINIVGTRVTSTTLDESEVRIRVNYPFDRGLLDVTNHFMPSAVVCRSPRAVGAFFDTDMPVVEDWEFWQRLRHRHGYQVVHQPNVSVVQHRIPGVESLTGTSSEDADNLKMYENNWRLVTSRYPTSDDAVAYARRFMAMKYEIAYERIRQGVPLDHDYYERVLQVLYRALGDPRPAPEQVEEELRAALDGH